MSGHHQRISAAILAGGLGSRLRSVVADRPKVLAPVYGRPYLTFLLDQLAEAGIAEVVLLTGYQAEQVRSTLGMTYAGMRLVYSQERSPLGTAGAVRWGLAKLSGSTVLLLNGDSYCDVNLAEFRSFHAQRAVDVSLVLAKAPAQSRFGTVWLDCQGRVERFEEKTADTGGNWINAGIYLLERRLIEEIPVERSVSLERDLFPAWIARQRVYGFRCAGRFLDIGTPEAYAEAESFFSCAQGS
ncbi:MAG TPA: nucleotidyltransferase family protein [Gemmataceae bacterium]|nr:nucleotidyltransferase family protein [Gemmataceae bacterium]